MAKEKAIASIEGITKNGKMLVMVAGQYRDNIYYFKDGFFTSYVVRVNI